MIRFQTYFYRGHGREPMLDFGGDRRGEIGVLHGPCRRLTPRGGLEGSGPSMWDHRDHHQGAEQERSRMIPDDRRNYIQKLKNNSESWIFPYNRANGDFWISTSTSSVSLRSWARPGISYMLARTILFSLQRQHRQRIHTYT